jgi:hypothetical protein
MKMGRKPRFQDKHDDSFGKRGFSAGTWAAIASSIAALFSMILLFYQLYTDNPKLMINFDGAAIADDTKNMNLYLPVWLTGFNKGKRPIGILEAKLIIKLPDKSILKIQETPIFPRIHIGDKSKAPEIESPFFYEPSYYENPMKGGASYDLHPKSLEFKPRIFNVGTYQRGYLVFLLVGDEREKFLSNTNNCEVSLKVLTTKGDENIEIFTINKWTFETFTKRFLIIN